MFLRGWAPRKPARKPIPSSLVSAVKSCEAIKFSILRQNRRFYAKKLEFKHSIISLPLIFRFLHVFSRIPCHIFPSFSCCLQICSLRCWWFCVNLCLLLRHPKFTTHGALDLECPLDEDCMIDKFNSAGKITNISVRIVRRGGCTQANSCTDTNAKDIKDILRCSILPSTRLDL